MTSLKQRPQVTIWHRIIHGSVGWIGGAFVLMALLGLFHLLGWRDDTAIISGTFASANGQGAVMRGVLYALAYFAAIIVSPILLLAAVIEAMLERIWRQK